MQWGRVRHISEGQPAAEVWNLEVEEDNSYIADGVVVHNCQAYSYMAMPWKLAKAKAAAIRADTSGAMLADLNRLFEVCFRIQAQASLAAGWHIPMVVENVRGAQPWVGRARWNFGSFYLWGDVPALMPITVRDGEKGVGPRWDAANGCGAHGMTRWTNPAEGFKQHGSGAAWWDKALDERRKNPFGIKNPGCDLTAVGFNKRKAASAMIAKIPLPLSRHIAAVYRS